MDEAAAGAPEQVVGVVAEHATDGGAGVLDAAQGVAQHDAVLAVFDERAEAPADRLGLGPAGPLGGEQPRVVDRDRRVLGDAAERTLLGVGEPARDAHGDRQHADDGAAAADRHPQHPPQPLGPHRVVDGEARIIEPVGRSHRLPAGPHGAGHAAAPLEAQRVVVLEAGAGPMA